MIPLAVLLTSIPPGSRDLLEFGFFVTVGITAGSFGEGKYSNQSIYECADDWCSKQVTTSGLVNYYKAYYTGEKYK